MALLLGKRVGQVNEIFRDLEHERITPTVAIVKARYDAAVGNKKVRDGVVQLELLEYIERYVEDRRSICSWNGYLRKFKTVKDHLVSFRPEIRFQNITHHFYNELLTYFFDELELENNTVSGYLKKLKSVMGAAIIDPRTKHQQIPIDFKLFKDTYIKPKPFWLDWEPYISALERFEPLPEKKVYKEEFLFRCYTGLRHTDLFNAEPENFIKRGSAYFIDFMGMKTRVDQNLRLNDRAVSILKEWSGKPPRLQQDACNLEIKDICKAAWVKLPEMRIQVVRYRGNIRKIENPLIHQLVTTHTARRTFGRRWMENGGSLRNLSVYFGHSNERQTAEYIGWTTEEVNKEMLRVI